MREGPTSLIKQGHPQSHRLCPDNSLISPARDTPHPLQATNHFWHATILPGCTSFGAGGTRETVAEPGIPSPAPGRASPAPADTQDPPVSHREAAPGVAHGQEGVVVLVAQVSRAPGQLRPAPVLAVVVAQGAVVDHGRDVGEHTLWKQTEAARASGGTARAAVPAGRGVGAGPRSGTEHRTTTPRLLLHLKLLLNQATSA